MTQSSSDLVTKAEAAAMLRVSVRTIDRYMQHHLTPQFTPTGRVRFARADVLALLSPTPPVPSPPDGTGVFFRP